MPHALVIEPDAIIREPLVSALESWGFTTVGVVSSGQAWEAIGRQMPDLVVIEPDLGVESGFRLVGRMISESTRHSPAVVVLTHCSARDKILEAARIGVRHYLLKSNFNLEQFRHRVDLAIRRVGLSPLEVYIKAKQAVGSDPAQDTSGATASNAAAGGPDATTPSGAGISATGVTKISEIESILPKDRATELIQNYGQCRALSPMFNYAMKLLNDSQASIESIAAALKRDQAIATRVLRAANSGGYNRGRAVHTVEQAAVRIGISELRNIVMGIAVMEEFGGSEFEGFIDVMEFWEHGLATAMICQEIARETRSMDTEEAFLVGLLHDVGRVVMIEQFGPGMVNGFVMARELDQPLHIIEKRLYNLDHADIAGLMFKEWHFPNTLIVPVATHHLSLANLKHIHPGAIKQTATLITADRLANILMLGSSGNEWLNTLDDAVEEIDLSPQAMDRIIQRIPDRIDELKCGLSAASGMVCEKRTLEGCMASFDGPVHPEPISVTSAPDSIAIMLGRLSGPDTAAPNLAVVHLTDTGQVPALVEKLAQADARAGRTLPVLVHHAHKVDPPPDLLEGRRARSIELPRPYDGVLAAVAELLAEPEHLSASAAPADAA